MNQAQGRENRWEATRAWENLYHAAKALEQGRGDWREATIACRAAMEMLLEFPPGQVVALVEQSDLPTRAVVSWLAFEGARLGGPYRESAATLALHWEALNLGQRVIAPPAPDQEARPQA
ncbi:MAG: hypothetical protein KQH53_19230 [Desulfarculaceae bacterium]|nr:hypothetical protein [Desulfarculaceae bacterium]